MSFLAPLFFVGLAAIGIPILVHLIQRERKDVIEFPSLMFLRRIPYQSVERRRIHNWLLLLLRAAAMALIVAAFSRPFLKVDPVKAAALTSGAREVVVLLDRSASMGYGDHFARAKAEAKKIVDALRGEDKGTLVLFARNTEQNVKATQNRGLLSSAIDEATVSSDSTRYGPALRLAQTLLGQSQLPRKEVYLISDFQKSGWARQEEIHLPEGATLTPISVAEFETSDLSISSVTLPRSSFSGEERVTPTVGLTNRGSETFTNVAVKVLIDGREIGSKPVTVGPNTSASVTFPPFTVSEANMQGTIRAGTDKLPANNVYYFTLSPSRPVSVLIVQAEGAAGTSDYLTTALQMGNTPPFKTDVQPVSRLTAASLDRRSVVILNDASALSSQFDEALKHYVEQGGGLLIVTGDHNPWGGGDTPLLPGKLGAPVDRTVGQGGTLGYLDYSHRIFENFKDPRQGNFSNSRFLRYRSLQLAPTDRALARFDDGAVAMAERKVGAGRVIIFTATLDDSWDDLPKRPMFLPLLHETMTYLAQYEDVAPWYTVGQMLDVSAPLASLVREGGASDASAPARRATGIVMTPGGKQLTLGEGGAPSIELGEQGFYSVRMQGTGERRPFEAAVNQDPGESDLTPLQPAEFVASATGHAAVTPTGQSLEHPDLTPEDIEKKQSWWWFLLVGGVIALLAEAAMSNRLSAKAAAGFQPFRQA
ncbi:MAG TPA: BatA domain-containing protein [Vicinamibacterales bacterium]|nr:BatA domain-containing protein [Vicinamibacterales bacterium]